LREKPIGMVETSHLPCIVEARLFQDWADLLQALWGINAVYENSSISANTVIETDHRAVKRRVKVRDLVQCMSVHGFSANEHAQHVVSGGRNRH